MTHEGHPWMELCQQRFLKFMRRLQTQNKGDTRASLWQDRAGIVPGWPQAGDVQEEDSLGLKYIWNRDAWKHFLKPSNIMTWASEDQKESRSLSREVEGPSAKQAGGRPQSAISKAPLT